MDMKLLKACVQYLTEAINQKSQTINSINFKLLLTQISQLIDTNDLALQILISKPDSNYCLYCQTESPTSKIGLTCAPQSHFFCNQDCFKKHVLVSTNNTLLELHLVVCPNCHTPIEESQINQIFNGKLSELQNDACDRALLQLLDEQDKQRMKARFTCMICYSQLKVQQGITLECDDRFCTDCIKQHMEYLIETAQVADQKLKCPNCPQPLSLYEIQGIVSEEFFEKFEKFKLRGLDVENGEELIFYCMGTDCEYFCILDKDADEFECPKCKFKCCPQCREEYHGGSTCDQFMEWRKVNGKGQELLDQLLIREGLLKCPECGAVVERISGCQYMTCMSSRCQGRTYFCYHCGIKLQGDHAAHDCKPRKELNGYRPPVFVRRPPRGRRLPVRRRPAARRVVRRTRKK